MGWRPRGSKTCLAPEARRNSGGGAASRQSGKPDPKAASGYVTEAQVIELAQNAGFELGGRSEINANAKDTKDHPWRLDAPSHQSFTTLRRRPGSHRSTFDRAKYEAIGESDRMTLKFIKRMPRVE